MTDVDTTGEDAIREYDRIKVRMLTNDDLDAVVRIDKRSTGEARRDYFELKLKQAMEDTRIVVSLGAEIDDALVGFLMGKLYYGEFGIADPVAILDTIGVEPERAREGIGKAMLEQFRMNLRVLGIEKIQTQAGWNEWRLLRFLEAQGFEPVPRLSLEARI